MQFKILRQRRTLNSQLEKQRQRQRQKRDITKKKTYRERKGRQ